MTVAALNTMALNFDQTSNLICRIGHKRTILAEGHMGIGKSSMLSAIGRILKELKSKDYLLCYCDCTTKDVGDIMIPVIHEIDDSGKFVRFVTNEELGAHTGKPVVIMLDEFGKCNRAVQNALRRLMLERKIGSYTLHPDSIIFATTNLGAENVGDLMEAHKRNAIISIRMTKPTAEEWIINFGVPNNLHTAVLGFANEYPQIFQSFDDVKDPADNPYIFHPREERLAFITPRSLHACSDVLAEEEHLDKQTLQAGLVGAIGIEGGMKLMSFVSMVGQLPSLDSIKQDPMGAVVPHQSAPIIMTVTKVLGAMDRELIAPWMKYIRRLTLEAQSFFGRSALHRDYKQQKIVTQSAEFGEWSRENAQMFTADKV